MVTITSKQELKEEMVVANERQKDLLKKRDILLENKSDKDNQVVLRITHEIAKLEDFIRMAENTLKMSD
ncbi:MAG: hypothetical protein H2B05_04015 [Nitrosopumilaceae archaeon]|uniref:Uncharacterized protein n=3 Tax=Candidatus Nitrosomaritimum aestuariumsis TaxID=3342354 RepID=A0AC60W657_9ARCH|nr:hypothetical protein [Nitrosopumilaceae archaeon]MBA4454090.1 hypothetical protein [Nitrosopumilaceae archaeon]MBA4460703.1 hypothetical protein [Nitrosopumilaceae archaeon]MBA4461487.1 hypothetical protein [Nitrosopumilaceae archaeon]MBA4462624.1 hypothetical protein [Nitrosopumilaceae archaeon]